MPQTIIPNKPFALSMGPQRAGTTWIDRYLRSRGDVCLPEEVKEVFFFDRNFDRGYDFYKSHFVPEERHILGMEITATSFDCPNAPKRVYETFGKDVRLICPLRHPAVRSYSLYLHYLRYGIVSGSLKDAVLQMPQILESSHYAAHLNRWYQYFDAKNITFVFQEELESDQGQFVKKVCLGLGIDFLPPEEEVQGRYNITTYSKFGPLARFAQNSADFLRENRLYFIINLAKNLGIKRLIFGKERPDANKKNIPLVEKRWLFDQLNGEVEKFEALVGYKISYWDEIEKNKNNEK